ncbi:hypothetical protein DLE04_00920 [Actinobacteria bacterium IMCC26103]|nr:hypothetical protein DLE04_00920 [Actinobacteria bacterium IMCC26103]
MDVENDNSYTAKTNLLIFNYATDEKDQVFAHQIEVVRQLSIKFRKVYVITASRGFGSLPSNVTCIESKWVQGKHFSNSTRLIKNFLGVVLRDKNIVVFSHMTEVQSALVSPLTKFLRMKHIVWYAHASRSLAMNLNKFMLNSIVTSTVGSCPYTGNKVKILGQAIDEKRFKFTIHKIGSPYNFVHIGRTDPSKDINKLMRFVEDVNSMGYESTFTIVGRPSNPKFNFYIEDLYNLRKGFKEPLRVVFREPMERNSVPDFLESFSIFIHAFIGSLDKTLVEATLCGIPVLSINHEYRSIFGCWSNTANSSLEDEFLALIGLSPEELALELKRRRKIAEEQHSLSGWIEKILTILTN